MENETRINTDTSPLDLHGRSITVGCDVRWAQNFREIANTLRGKTLTENVNYRGKVINILDGYISVKVDGLPTPIEIDSKKSGNLLIVE